VALREVTGSVEVLVRQYFGRGLALIVSAPARFGGGSIVGVNPNPGGVPGSAAVQSIADGIAWWALLLSLLGLVIGAASWAIGSHSANYQYATSGRRAVLVSGLAALIIGAAPALINFFFSTGQHVH
jgi:hypothetical protein